MTKPPEQDWGQELPELPGHTLGIFEQDYNREGFTEALTAIGLPNSKILVFEGEDGLSLMQRMLEGSQWGESAETFLKKAVSALERGQCVVSVAVRSQREAERISQVAASFGGHSVYYFGELVDVQFG